MITSDKVNYCPGVAKFSVQRDVARPVPLEGASYLCADVELLTAERAVRFEAVQMPPCFRLMLAGIPRAVPMPGGWVVMRIENEIKSPFLLGLSETDAKSRAARLSTKRRPDGVHSWN